MPAIPSSNKYPEFVPDQLLTNEHLNNLFRYTDSEGRATRSRLIGIGVVCGLEVRATGTSITITKGCGITTAGYLVRLEEDTTYTHSRPYDPLTEHAYDRFLNAGGGGPAFDLRELKAAAATEDTTPLTAAALQGKAVIMFVELLAEGAKNCDPASCDDKGTTVTVSFLPMLVDAASVQALMGGSENSFSTNAAADLALLRMPRYDVPATPLVNAAGVLDGFRKVLTPAFLKVMEAALSKAYSVFVPLVSDLYPVNPFDALAQDFAEQYSDLDTATMLGLQYHYDLFSDLMLAHDELRQAGEKLLAVCCPDEDLFPRHLVLGAVGGGGPRHSFQPSAALAGEGRQVASLRILFRRLVLLVQRFSVPAPKQSGKKSKALPIRITPSQWGTEPLSNRAIPFYYRVENSAPALFQHWNAERARMGTSAQTLSYHAAQYNASNPVVTDPLKFDLEPFDFLRIEGHIGQKMPTALAAILKQKAEARLPFEVVALGADLRNVSRLIRRLLQQQRAAITNLTNANTATGIRTNLTTLNRAAAAPLQSAAGKAGLLGDCHVQDLEAIYDTLRAELECMLCCEMQYFYGIEPQRNKDNRFNNATGAAATATAPLIPAVPLLKKCAPEFRYKSGSLGASFEALWPTLASKPYNSPDQWLEQVEALLAASAGNATGTNKDVLGLLMALLLIYYIEKLWEILPASLSVFDAEAFATRYEDLMQVARAIKELINDDLTGDGNGDNNQPDLFMTEDVVDHLDALIYACKDAAFEAVYREFLLRYMRALLRQKFGFFANQHPGIQHKAGVPVGGTFILVYHEAEIELEDEEEEAQNVLVTAQARQVAFKTFFQAKKAQAMGAARGDTAASAKTEANTATAAGFNPEELEMKVVKQTTTYSKLLTEGDAKAMTFFEKYSTTLSKDEDEDTTLQDLLDELPDGTVIADFCLPYLCCSDCPPMQFVVRGADDEEPEPEKPTLSIGKKDYCADEDGEYPIVVTPAGGKLTGEGTNDSKLTFRPSAVTMPTDKASVDITLSYTTDGGTATRTVTVSAVPKATFSVTKTPSAPLVALFADTSTHGQTREWDFGDGDTSTDKTPQHAYAEKGTYTVTLTAHNGPCRDTVTEQVRVGSGGEEPACAPLAPAIKVLAEVLESNTAAKKNFLQAFEREALLKEFVDLLQQAELMPVSEQLAAFRKKDAPGTLEELLKATQRVIENGKNNALAFEVYRALLAVAFYIACIQGTDLGRMRVKLDGVLKTFKEHVAIWAELSRQWSAADNARRNSVRAQTQTERDRADATGRSPEYVDALDSILPIFSVVNT